jgi:AcrR family transcriptional regulator
VALQLMTAGGPDAITLRAIAREMGMSANAIYGHLATCDDLVTTLIGDVSSDLADALETAGRHPQNPLSRFPALPAGLATICPSNAMTYRSQASFSQVGIGRRHAGVRRSSPIPSGNLRKASAGGRQFCGARAGARRSWISSSLKSLPGVSVVVRMWP